MADELRVTQQGAEPVIVDPDAQLSVTQQGADVVTSPDLPVEARVTQNAAEPVILFNPSPIQITATGLDIVILPLEDVVPEECIDVSGRIITTPLNDETLRPQFIGHKMIVEVTQDPLTTSEDDATWSVQDVAFVTRAALVDALTWHFTISDTDRQERNAHLFAGPDLIVGAPSAFLGGPVAGGFGELADAGLPIFRVDGIESGEFLVLRYVEGPLNLNYANPLQQLFSTLFNQLYCNQIAAGFAEPSDLYTDFGRAFIYPQIIVELYDPTTGALVTGGFGTVREVSGQFTPISKRMSWLRQIFGTALNVEDDRLFDPGFEFAIDWGDVQPALETRYAVYMYVAQATTLTPFHMDGHPVDLAVAIYDALGIEYDADSAATTKALLGPDLRILLRPTDSETALDVLENWLQGPAGFAYRVQNGIRYFYPTRYRDGSTPSETLTIEDVRGEGTPYDLADQGTVTRVVWEEQSFLYWNRSLDIPLDDRPLDGLLPRPVTITQNQDDDNAASNGGEQIYRYPGQILDPYPVANGTQPSFKQHVAEEIFFRWGRGNAEVTLPMLPGFPSLIGEFIVNELEYSPIPEAGQLLITIRPKDYPSRHPRQILQITKRSESPAGPTITAQVVGPVAQDVTDSTGTLETPTITIAAATNAPNNVAVVTVTNWSTIRVVTGNRVEMQYGTGSSEPLQWNTAGSLYGGTAGRIGTPLLPAGSHVWARARTWNTDGRFSDWSSVVDLVLDSLDPPTDFVGTREGDTLAFVFTWVNGEPAEPLVLRFAVGLDQEYTEIGVLPAGSTRFEYAFEDVNTQYRVEIFHRQTNPVLSESPHVEILVTTGSTQPQLSPPLDPDATTGNGSVELCVTVGDGNADQTVFQYAAEESGGGFGSWVTYAIQGHAGNTVCASAFVPQESSPADPTRNRFYQVQAYHVALGYVNSDPTTVITVDPWSFMEQPEPHSLVNDDGNFLQNDDGGLLHGY